MDTTHPTRPAFNAYATDVTIRRPLLETVTGWTPEGARVTFPKGEVAEYAFAMVEPRDNPSEPQNGFYTSMLRIIHTAEANDGRRYSFTSYVDPVQVWRRLQTCEGYSSESLALSVASGEASLQQIVTNISHGTDSRDAYIARIWHGYHDGRYRHRTGYSIAEIIEKDFEFTFDLAWLSANTDYLIAKFQNVCSSVVVRYGPDLDEDADIYVAVPGRELLWRTFCEPVHGVSYGWEWEYDVLPGRFLLKPVS